MAECGLMSIMMSYCCTIVAIFSVVTLIYVSITALMCLYFVLLFLMVESPVKLSVGEAVVRKYLFKFLNAYGWLCSMYESWR